MVQSVLVTDVTIGDRAGRAVLVQDGRIAWSGDAAAAPSTARVVAGEGALLTPAFVDAHVHATATGLALTGLDLHSSLSLGDVVASLRSHAEATPGGVLLGTGWDETGWPERRGPTRADVDAVVGDRPVYLARVDVHSATVSTALLDRVPGITELPGFSPDGRLCLDAHHAARQAAYGAVDAAQRGAAQRATRTAAAALGIGSLHEMAGPEVSGVDDLATLVAIAAAEPGPRVFGYWGELAERGGLDVVRELGLTGAGGDLFCDGALGSHTAALRRPYSDRPETAGHLRFEAASLVEHVRACTAARVQAGFHVIGDAAVDQVLAAVGAVVDELGPAAVRACRHRLEHVEMVSPAAVQRLRGWGMVASVQPAFDAAWGGDAGMYAERLGVDRALDTNPFADLADAGVALALGSDAPVTPLDPWGGVHAAVDHHTPGSGLRPFTPSTRPRTAAGTPSAPSTRRGRWPSGRRATWRCGRRRRRCRRCSPRAAGPPAGCCWWAAPRSRTGPRRAGTGHGPSHRPPGPRAPWHVPYSPCSSTPQAPSRPARTGDPANWASAGTRRMGCWNADRRRRRRRPRPRPTGSGQVSDRSPGRTGVREARVPSATPTGTLERPAGSSGRDPATTSRRRLPWRTLLAAVAGVLLLLAFPGSSLPLLAPLGPAALALAVHGQRARVGAWLGLVAGLAFFVPLLSWTGIFVGALPWLALATSQAVYVALLGAATAATSRLPLWPLWAAALWVGQEALRGRFPFGGFPWGRLGLSQTEGPFLALAAYGGVPLVGFAVALTGTLLAAAVLRLRSGGRRAAALTALGALAVPALGGLAWLPLPGSSLTAGGPTRTVAVVQGDVPQPGLEFNARRRAVLDNHVAQTIALAEAVAAGEQPRPDLVVWPENSSDIDPYRNADAAREIGRAARAVGAPVLVGAVVSGPGEFISNTAIVWDPETGPGDTYVKRHPVPFAEYVPFRDFFRLFSDKVDLVRRDFAAGHEVGLLEVGGSRIADVICFEVVYDGLVHDAVSAGAGMIVVQTNNATFGYSAESEQQVAAARVRAVEFGRSVALASTSGISTVIAPDGSLAAASGLFEPAVFVEEVAQRDSATLAQRLGAAPEELLSGLGAGALLAAAAPALRRRLRRGTA